MWRKKKREQRARKRNMYDVQVVLTLDEEYPPVAVKGFLAESEQEAEQMMLAEWPQAAAVWALTRENTKMYRSTLMEA